MATELPISVSVNDARSLLEAREDVCLLDCRLQQEYDIVHLPSSILIPMDQLAERVAELEDFRHTPLIVYCHMGVRSEMVANWLRSQGFTAAQSMEGGIDAWSIQIDPNLARY